MDESLGDHGQVAQLDMANLHDEDSGIYVYIFFPLFPVHIFNIVELGILFVCFIIFFHVSYRLLVPFFFSRECCSVGTGT